MPEPIRDRIRRFVRNGDEYTSEEDVELEEVLRAEEPPVDIQGEPWGWTKPGFKPRGWRPDGRYGIFNRNDPGPNDGKWDDE
jgi:hypothetical protein